MGQPIVELREPADAAEPEPGEYAAEPRQDTAEPSHHSAESCDSIYW